MVPVEGNSYKWSLLRFLCPCDGVGGSTPSTLALIPPVYSAKQAAAIHLHRQREELTQKGHPPWPLSILISSCSFLRFNHREEEWAFQLSGKIFLFAFLIFTPFLHLLITQFGCEFLLLFPPTETCRTADCSEMGERLHPKKISSPEVLFFKVQDFSSSLIISDSIIYWC